jgi:hypothetical protein
MGNFYITKALAATNYARNPQFYFNITDGWTNNGVGTGARSAEWQAHGPASLQLTAGATNARFISNPAVTLADGDVVRMQVDAYSADTTGGKLEVYDQTNATVRDTAQLSATGTPELLEADWTNSTGGPADVVARLVNSANDSGSIVYFDGMVITVEQEIGEYFDGDTLGCKWNGTPHNSTTTRSGNSRLAGEEVDLDDYNVYLRDYQDLGPIMPNVNSVGYADRPGSRVESTVDADRVITLIADVPSSTLATSHSETATLFSLFNHDAVPRQANGIAQPVRLTYTGGSSDVYIYGQARPDFSGQWSRGFVQRYPIQIICNNPNWYSKQSAGGALDTSDDVTFRYCARRDYSTGQWGAMGLTNNPTANGTIYKVLAGSDGLIYYFGQFTDMDTVAGRSMAAIYDPVAGTWASMDDSTNPTDTFSGTIKDAVELPDGTIVVVGSFTNADNDANADYTAVYDPSTGDVSAYSSSGSPGAAVDVCAYYNGELYVGYDSGGSGYVKKSSGAAWTDLSAADFAVITDLEFDDDGILYVAGYSGIPTTGTPILKSYDGTSWTTLISSGTGALYVVRYYQNALYLGGIFYDINGVDCAGIARYFPESDFTQPLGDGLFDEVTPGGYSSGAVYDIQFSPDGTLWAGCLDVSIDTDINGIAIWSGGSSSTTGVWMRADAYLGNTSVQVYSIAFGDPDPTNNRLYDIYVGTATTGAGYTGGDLTVTNAGSAIAYPKIMIRRDGGTSLTLYSIRNEKTGVWLRFQYDLEDGEWLLIDTHPDRQSIWSSYKRGFVPNALLAPTSLSDFYLMPGSQIVTCYAEAAGAPTVTANIYFDTPYKGVP